MRRDSVAAFNVMCVVSTGAWLPLQGCVTEAQQKTGV